MKSIDFNNKAFKLLRNSSNGQVDNDTIFRYKQEGTLVTADYYGGSIIYGKIIARLESDTLLMLYNCLTDDSILKAGKATGLVSINSDGKIKLELDWQWFESHETGKSTYIEI